MSVKHTFNFLNSTAAGVVRITETRNLTARSAIKFHCLDCSGGMKADVRDCNIKTCPLYPFRPYQNSKIKPNK